MFGKKKDICSICQKNEGSKNLSDGIICKSCISKSGLLLLPSNWKSVSVQKVMSAIKATEENGVRMGLYNKTQKVEKYFEIDEVNRLWKSSYLPHTIFSYDEIIEFELLENGNSITKGGLGSAIVGGALFGGVGAIVGAAVGKKRTKQEITQFEIKIKTSHVIYPDVHVNFLLTGKIKEGSLLYKSYSASAEKILIILKNIVNNRTVQNSLDDSITNELVNLKKLLDSEIITQEEFEQKKKQLLNL